MVTPLVFTREVIMSHEEKMMRLWFVVGIVVMSLLTTLAVVRSDL